MEERGDSGGEIRRGYSRKRMEIKQASQLFCVYSILNILSCDGNSVSERKTLQVHVYSCLHSYLTPSHFLPSLTGACVWHAARSPHTQHKQVPHTPYRKTWASCSVWNTAQDTLLSPHSPHSPLSAGRPPLCSSVSCWTRRDGNRPWKAFACRRGIRAAFVVSMLVFPGSRGRSCVGISDSRGPGKIQSRWDSWARPPELL